MFNKEDIELGRALVKDKLMPHLKQIQWKTETIDDLVSYLAHHRFLNTIDTRRALLYLCTIKHKSYDSIEFMTRSDTSDSIFTPLLLNIIIDYVDTRDYKVLQYIYNKEYDAIYIYAFFLYFRNAEKSSIWRRSIMVWDIDFYKNMIVNMILCLPSYMRTAILPAIMPDEKFLSQLKLYDMNSKAFKYYEHKIALLHIIYENYGITESKTH